MNQQTAPQNALELAVQNGKAVSIASAKGAKLAPESLGEVVRFAEIMSRAQSAIPKHLRDNPGACMAVAMQALEWDMSPFAVASKSYVVNDVIAYEAQLITAVVNTRSGIDGRLKYKFEGEGPDRVCIVTGMIDGDELEYRSPRFEDIKPKNSPLWMNDPDQQQCYFSARAWARRHTPEVILGVYDREEAQGFQGPDGAKDITPRVPLSERLAAANAAESGEGFSQDHVEAETAEYTEIEDQPDQSFGAAGQTSANAEDAPGDDGLPSEDAPGAPEQNAADEYIEQLRSMGDADALQELTNEFMNDIMKLPKADQDRAEAARQKRRQEIAEALING
ncbi:recombinase RecT [Roseibium sp.]|uniref:recombinase RecT n=1 Tax=Roseibium sp. TaxID=1936156 RepID=UPI003B5298FF